MGLVLDSNVLIRIERGQRVDFSQWEGYGDAFISALTVSELLVGVHRADSEGRRTKRLAYIETMLSRFEVLPFTEHIARVHSEVFALLMQQGRMIGAHDLLIATTALSHGYAVLTAGVEEFSRVPGLEVISINNGR